MIDESFCRSVSEIGSRNIYLIIAGGLWDTVKVFGT